MLFMTSQRTRRTRSPIPSNQMQWDLAEKSRRWIDGLWRKRVLAVTQIWNVRRSQKENVEQGGMPNANPWIHCMRDHASRFCPWMVVHTAILMGLGQMKLHVLENVTMCKPKAISLTQWPADATQLCQELLKQYNAGGFPFVTLRLANVFGPKENTIRYWLLRVQIQFKLLHQLMKLCSDTATGHQVFSCIPNCALTPYSDIYWIIPTYPAPRHKATSYLGKGMCRSDTATAPGHQLERGSHQPDIHPRHCTGAGCLSRIGMPKLYFVHILQHMWENVTHCDYLILYIKWFECASICVLSLSCLGLSEWFCQDSGVEMFKANIPKKINLV